MGFSGFESSPYDQPGSKKWEQSNQAKHCFEGFKVVQLLNTNTCMINWRAFTTRMSVKFGLVLIHCGDGGHRREGRSCRLDCSKGMNVLALPKKIVCMYV